MLVGPSRSFEVVVVGVFVRVDSSAVSVRAGLVSTGGKGAVDYSDVLSLFSFTSFVGEGVDFVKAWKAFVRESHNERYVKKPKSTVMYYGASKIPVRFAVHVGPNTAFDYYAAGTCATRWQANNCRSMKSRQ